MGTNKEELLKNLIFCVVPLDEYETFHVTSYHLGKETKGDDIKVVKTYEVYLVNNSTHDIAKVKVLTGGFASDEGGVLETSKTVKDMGKLSKGSSILLETLDFGMLDFVNWYNFDIKQDSIPGYLQYQADINKAYSLREDVLKTVPVLDRNGYILPIKERAGKEIDEVVKGLDMNSKYTANDDSGNVISGESTLNDVDGKDNQSKNTITDKDFANLMITAFKKDTPEKIRRAAFQMLYDLQEKVKQQIEKENLQKDSNISDKNKETEYKIPEEKLYMPDKPEDLGRNNKKHFSLKGKLRKLSGDTLMKLLLFLIGTAVLIYLSLAIYREVKPKTYEEKYLHCLELGSNERAAACIRLLKNTE